MSSMILASGKKAIPFVVEESAFSGVRKIAKKVCKDVEAVSGGLPAVKDSLKDCTDCVVIAGTIGKSDLLDKLAEEKKLNLDAIRGKREVYSLSLVEQPGEGIKTALVIAGSDKLGTIYGLFALSEYIGVSPMCDFGDAQPLTKEELVIGQDIETVSKEPSVRYRGFFINDEWPCFGNWTFGHFGGFTAEMYDHVFEFLLRMKGNFLWPAMWTSSFGLDGPGSLNEELADEYGITVSYSHHEPCLRASEEWDKVRGEDSVYGNEWNFYTNKEGLTRYWGDGLARSGKYNHLVTIGMRGERDSSMLGPDATLKDNIDLLKDVITTQRRLIGEHVNADVDSVPQLLALYKEVEAYFYGDENTQGLKEWKELENVIFMLCEDNFGHMRTLPTEDIRDHKGGFGMYYHFDYHGGPVSYEWMPSTTLALTWEQMTEAYDYGIKDVWIVNVGDLKGNEVALQYFLTLAYDFETWGSSAPNSWQKYIVSWAEKVFPGVDKECAEQMAQVYVDFVEMNAMRRPEVMAGTYHPCRFMETDRMLALCSSIEERNEAIYEKLSGVTKEAYYSMIYYPAKSSVNLLRMHLYAGKNKHYAMQGRKVANLYGRLMRQCIDEDTRLKEEFGAFKSGKWKGMELEEHIGFTKWNDDGWRYPVRMYVEPVTKPRMSVSRADAEFLAVKNYGSPIIIPVRDFLKETVEKVVLEISNDGIGVLHYTIRPENGEIPSWLSVSSLEGDTEELTYITLTCDKEKLGKEQEAVRLLISDGDATVAVEVIAGRQDVDSLPTNTFSDVNDCIVMEAHHFSRKKDAKGGSFTHLERYGRSGNGMKVLPSTLDFTADEEKPELTYSFQIHKPGVYRVELWSTPVNSVQDKRPLNICVSTKEEKKVLEVLSKNYRGGENSCGEWCSGVLNQIRVTGTSFQFESGIQELTVGAMEAGYVLERIVIYLATSSLGDSYLGPEESFYKKN